MILSSRPPSPFTAVIPPVVIEHSPAAIASLQQARREEEDSIDSWRTFLEAYSLGLWTGETEIPQGLLRTRREVAENDDSSSAVIENENKLGEVGVELKLAQAMDVREAFRATGYLAPPVSQAFQ